MMKRQNKIIVLIGAMMILASLAWMVQPYYTWAQEQNDAHPCRVALEPDESLFELENMNPGDETTRTVTVTKTGTSSANLYMTWDFISGDPFIGEPGSLFEHLILVIKHKDKELYRGLMMNGPQVGSPSQLTDALYIAFMEYGDELELDFTVILPGPTTGNVFQGSTLVTKIVFYTICSEEEDTTPVIDIEKHTNGVDADAPSGPFIPIGGDVTWDYIVTNPGRVPLSNVVVTDSRLAANPVYISGDTNSDGILQVGEAWLFRATGTAQAGQYANVGMVVGISPKQETVTASDPSHYYGTTLDETVINIEKHTNGVDADLPTGPQIAVGGNVTWTYLVTNPNTIPLYNIVVTDNRTSVNPVYVSGDVNADNVLQPVEVWTYRATGIAVSGQYSNVGSVTGASASGKVVTDRDPSHYFGFVTPPPPGGEIVVDPDDPLVEPDPEEDDSSSIIVKPEGPRSDPPLPRTDGVSIGLFVAGLLLLLAGVLMTKSREDDQEQEA